MANSKPPPRQKPRTSAKVGYLTAARRSNASQPRLTMATASASFSTSPNSSTSAPAMKPFAFPEAMTSPLGGSRSSSSSASLSSASTSRDNVFVVVPALSKVRRAKPSASRVSVQCRMSDPLHQHGAAQAAADADRRHAAPASGADQRIQHMEHDARTRGADGMTERNGTAVDVELRFVELAHRMVETELLP